MKIDSKSLSPQHLHLEETLDARTQTRLRVLNCIREAGEASRTEIAAALSLSPATVTFVTSSLIAGGLAEECTESDTGDGSRRGRPRVAIRIRGGKHFVAGIKVARDALSILILDFNGEYKNSQTTTLENRRRSPQELVLTIKDAIAEACKSLPEGINSLSGLSIGLAGQVNSLTQDVHWSSSLSERNINLGPLLKEHIPCPTFVENDANLVAKAEHLFGEAKGLDNFLVITIEHGIGLGIVHKGQIFRGERGCGAEFGHTKVVLDGETCQCGQKGCLEAYSSSYAILNKMQKIKGLQKRPGMKDVLAFAEGGDKQTGKMLAEAGDFFGMGLANLINLFDPQSIILSGSQYPFQYLHSERVMQRIRDCVVNVDAPLPPIRVNHWSDMMWAQGATAVGIEKISVIKVKELK